MIRARSWDASFLELEAQGGSIGAGVPLAVTQGLSLARALGDVDLVHTRESAFHVQEVVSETGNVRIQGQEANPIDFPLLVDRIEALAGSVELVWKGTISDVRGDGASNIDAQSISLVAVPPWPAPPDVYAGVDVLSPGWTGDFRFPGGAPSWIAGDSPLLSGGHLDERGYFRDGERIYTVFESGLIGGTQPGDLAFYNSLLEWETGVGLQTVVGNQLAYADHVGYFRDGESIYTVDETTGDLIHFASLTDWLAGTSTLVGSQPGYASHVGYFRQDGAIYGADGASGDLLRFDSVADWISGTAVVVGNDSSVAGHLGYFEVSFADLARVESVGFPHNPLEIDLRGGELTVTVRGNAHVTEVDGDLSLAEVTSEAGGVFLTARDRIDRRRRGRCRGGRERDDGLADGAGRLGGRSGEPDRDRHPRHGLRSRPRRLATSL